MFFIAKKNLSYNKLQSQLQKFSNRIHRTITENFLGFSIAILIREDEWHIYKDHKADSYRAVHDNARRC